MTAVVLRDERGRASRLIAAALLLLQLAVAVTVPLADARAEARSVDASAHVESDTSGACRPVHQHAACTLCRTLRTAGTPTAHAAAWPPPCRDALAPVVRRVDGPMGRRASATHPRAPPTL